MPGSNIGSACGAEHHSNQVGLVDKKALDQWISARSGDAMANGNDDRLFEHIVRFLLASANGELSNNEHGFVSQRATKRNEEFKIHSEKARRETSSEDDIDQYRPSRAKFLGRSTAVTILICWSDSCHGRFDEQIWLLGTARANARCALSGEQIVQGDTIYHPRCTFKRTIPNAKEMILASALCHYENPGTS